MLKKKFFAKALAFAMVTGLMATSAPVGLGTQPVQALAAASTSGPTIEIDYADYTATITLSGAKYLFLEVLKDEKGKKVSGTYGYKADGGSVTVDLSFLKASKAQYLRAYSDQVDENGAYVRGEITTVSAQPGKLKIKYDAVKGLVDDKKTELVLGDTGKEVYSFKTLYGSDWAPLTSTALTDKNVAGTTILVRKTAVEKAADVAGTPASAEIKVKIPAIPKAPKVTIDYVKGMVKLGKGTEYATLDNALQDKWTETTEADAKGADVVKLLEALKGTGKATTPTTTLLVVRTKATDKKAASQWTFVTLKDLAELTPGSGDDAKVGGTLTLEEGKKLTWANTSKGISLKPEGIAFDYYDNAKKAWKAVAAGKEVEVKLKNGDKLQVRAAGTKATKKAAGTFFSASTELTCATLPAKITIKPSATSVKVNTKVTCEYEVVDGNGEKLTVEASKVTWTASGAGSPSYSSGFTPTAAGEMTITAKIGDVTGTVTVTVEAADK